MFRECQRLPRIKSKHTARPAFHFPLCWHGKSLCQVLEAPFQTALAQLADWAMFSLEIQ